MSTQIDDGGAAFPHSSQPLDAQGNPMMQNHTEWGMSLRDWFAGHALAGYMAYSSRANLTDMDTAAVAAKLLKLADAMIEARKGGGS